MINKIDTTHISLIILIILIITSLSWLLLRTLKEGRKALKDHLRKRCRVTPGESSVKIMDNGQEVELFEDTWRTAGQTQKVATRFGGAMRECLQGKAAR